MGTKTQTNLTCKTRFSFLVKIMKWELKKRKKMKGEKPGVKKKKNEKIKTDEAEEEFWSSQTKAWEKIWVKIKIWNNIHKEKKKNSKFVSLYM